MAELPTKRQVNPKWLEIGQRIKEARKQKGLSQHGLAMHLGITAGAVGQWEVGYSTPTMSNFDQLPEVLDVSREWLLTGNESGEVMKAHTKAEETILRLSRALTGDQQATLIGMLTGLASPPGGAKRN
jgi:transcriptional regulator with XRE-family HTH domain